VHLMASFHVLVLAFESCCHSLLGQVNQVEDQVECQAGDQVEDQEDEPSKVHLA